jgi:hypothetical protein
MSRIFPFFALGQRYIAALVRGGLGKRSPQISTANTSKMERSAAYIRPSPAADGDPVNDFYMSEAQFSNPRKRQRTEQHPLPSPPPSKRQKELQHHSHGYIDSPAFWDNLSKIWLTKHTLRELNRRNAKPLPYSPPRRALQPVTQNFFAGNCTPETLKSIKLFARHGGPDLSDLRGVCIMRY